MPKVENQCKQCNLVFFDYLDNREFFCSKKCCALFKRIHHLTNNYRHGMSDTPFWNKWFHMRQRCFNKNHHKYPIYGGRGITVCSHWLNFDNFYKDMYSSYIEHVKQFGEKETTIDRIDTNKGYSRENCKWSTHKEQANNVTNNVMITYRGQTHTLAQWAETLGKSYGAFYSRIIQRDWSLERAFNQPFRKHVCKKI